MTTSPSTLRPSRPSRRTFVHLLAMVLLALGFTSPAFAKRVAPPTVTPVVIGAVEYSAPSEAMGFVVATDVQTGKELWRVRIYEVKIDPELEKDVQDVFINSMKDENGLLILTNERGAKFSLDPKTRKVTKVD